MAPRSDRLAAILAALLLVPACGGPGGGDADADAGQDAPADTVGRDAAGEPDAGPDGSGECTAPPVCGSAPGDHPVIGRSCTSDPDCGSGYDCLTEATGIFGDEIYTSWRGGACVLMGADEAGCDPDDPATCPDGTVCVDFGTSGGSAYHACVDACSFTDSSWNPLDWNCGCREGYECHVDIEACLPGCANDRECCEVWDDADGDGVREEGEVSLDDACTNWCDGNDEDEYPGTDCRASFACVNEGDPSATWHSECLFDSDCPADGRCLNEVHYTDDATGEPYYPDGLCLKDRCELMGRGCGAHADTGGECVNLGSTTDPFYACVATCRTGRGPEDGDLNPCRHPEAGAPYTCSPWPEERWFPASSAGSDGLCFPAMVPGGSAADLYSPCSADEGCVSPKGLGTCASLMDAPGFCSALCSGHLATEQAICGPAAAAGEVVPGVCALGICLASCSTPGAAPGANGCPDPSWACYPNDGSYGGGPGFRDPLGADPEGFCLPACAATAECELLWTGAVTCNTISGVCE